MPSAPTHDWFGLICAFRLDGQGGGHPCGWPEITADNAEAGPLWIHLDLNHANAQRWLNAESGLDPLIREALLSPWASPRFLARGDAILLILKGIELLPGQPVTDMVALRLWTDGRRVITLRSEKLIALDDLVRDIAHGRGPRGVGALIAEIADRLIAHMDQAIGEMLADTHRLGHTGDRAPTQGLVAELANLRRRMIRMRQDLNPQQRALLQLANSRLVWLHTEERLQIREVVNQCRQYIEGLDAAGQITAITQDEILQRSADKTSRRVYALTVLSAIFMPISFLTGLFGVNLEGIPEATDPFGFLLLCIAICVIVVLQLWLLHRKGWL